jgi:chlorite dismutase
MTLELAPLYAASALSIITLALFARLNRKTGWKRQRHSIHQELFDLQAEWHAQDLLHAVRETVAAGVPATASLSVVHAAEFTSQLGRLHRALDHPTTAPTTIAAREHEHVA